VNDWIAKLFEDPDMLEMGHCQRRDDRNLGMGWIYYGLARLIRPRNAVVIGSYRGYTPILIARALADNFERGEVHFVEPSLVDDFWKDPDRAKHQFEAHGISNVIHHPLTTQEFAKTRSYRDLDDVGLLLVDGYHTAEQARFDFETFAPKLTPDAVALFHDSVVDYDSRMYGEEHRFRYSVSRFIGELKADPAFQVLDLPFAFGLTLVRTAAAGDAAAEPTRRPS